DRFHIALVVERGGRLADDLRVLDLRLLGSGRLRQRLAGAGDRLTADVVLRACRVGLRLLSFPRRVSLDLGLRAARALLRFGRRGGDRGAGRLRADAREDLLGLVEVGRGDGDLDSHCRSPLLVAGCYRSTSSAITVK